MKYKNKFLYKCYTSDIYSISDVIKQMNNIDEELKCTNLHNLRSFNTTYLIITNNVFAKFGIGYFDNDILMEKFDVIFANYYFKALKNYVQKKKCALAWKEFFEQCEQDLSWEYVYMAMGVNAHVNNDLAFALKDIIVDPYYKADYDRVNEVISGSIKEVVQNLHEESLTLETAEKDLLVVYSIFLNVIIKKWRANAWDNFIKLQNGYVKPKFIEISSLNILKQILGLTYFRQFFSKGLSKLNILYHKI